MPKRFPPVAAASPRLDSTGQHCTDSGTAKYRQRFHERFVDDYFRRSTNGLWLSSIGVGTYLGESSDDDDAAYEAAVRHAVASGINVIDTAINYRSQRSELSVGSAIQRILAD